MYDTRHTADSKWGALVVRFALGGLLCLWPLVAELRCHVQQQLFLRNTAACLDN
jgi:hypothetical protein